MAFPPRPLAFVIAPTDQGTLIVNRFDFRLHDGGAVGVGAGLLNAARYDPHEVAVVQQLLALRRQHFGGGVMAIDCGANIGVFTVEWAKFMTGWGQVLSFEAQERVFYALAGNIAIGNCFNARAIHAAVGATSGVMRIPHPNYLAPGTVGSLELRPSDRTENIGQPIDYSEENTSPVSLITIDSLNLPRLDLLKVDVEGMEAEVLAGADATLARTRPIVFAEHIKSDRAELIGALAAHGYRHFIGPMNILAIHESDPSMSFIQAAS